MRQGPSSEYCAVETVLVEWRNTTVITVLRVSAIIYLPAVVLLIAGMGPQVGWPVRLAATGFYLTLLVFVLVRRIGYRTRAWVILACGYALAVVMGIAIPHGTFARTLPVVMPIFTIVLLGPREGWAAAALSTFLILVFPFLHTTGGLPSMRVGYPGTPITMGMAWTQAAAMLALLFAPMILLNRFLRFLMQALEELKQEAGERVAAYRKLEHEMLERRRLENEVIRIGDEERDRLGREIHDGVCQQLTGALLRSEALARRLNRGESLVLEDLSQLSSLIEETIDEAHAVAQGLCSLHPEPDALAGALRNLVKRAWEASGITCLFEAEGDVNVSESTTAQHLYRIAQEAVSNAERHAHAGRISVALRGDEEGLFLIVEDDGVGVPDEISSVGMGFRTMAYRASLLEGELEVAQGPSGGTRVSCRIPRGKLARPERRKQAIREVNHGF